MKTPDFKAYEARMKQRADDVADAVLALINAPAEDRVGRERRMETLRTSLLNLQSEPLGVIADMMKAQWGED